MINMVKVIPNGSCPYCGHKQFVVIESQLNIFLTNRDGEIIDNKELSYKARGKCCNCNREFEMMQTTYGFIPLSPLRKIIYNHTNHNESEEEYEVINNPMYKEME